MAKIIFKLLKSLDGNMVDTGDDRFEAGPVQRVTQSGQTKFAPSQSRGARATGMHLSDQVTNKGTHGQYQAGVAGTGAGVMFTASQTMNHHSANQAEDRGLRALEPSIRAMLPYNYGGVIVVSTFKVISPGRMFRNAIAVAWAPTAECGLRSYYQRGTIAERHTDTRIYFAVLDGPPADPKELMEKASKMPLMR